MNSRIAEILGLLYSDGTFREYLSSYIRYDKRRPNPYRANQIKRFIEFTNTDFRLLKHFKNIVNKEFEYDPQITHSNHNVFRVSIVKNTVLNELCKYIKKGKDNWVAPESIINGKNILKVAFLRGFFDGDGSVDFSNRGKIPRIRITSVNFTGIKQLDKMCKSLGLECNINGPYRSKIIDRRSSYELLFKTSSVNKFIRLIGSNHSKKRKRFRIILKIIKMDRVEK